MVFSNTDKVSIVLTGRNANSSCELNDWQKHILELYGSYKTSFADRIFKFFEYINEAKEEIERKIPPDNLHATPAMFTWLLSSVNMLGDISLQEVSWKKYRKGCPYCEQMVCICESIVKIWSLSPSDKSEYYKKLYVKNLRMKEPSLYDLIDIDEKKKKTKTINYKNRPLLISEWLDFFLLIYGQRFNRKNPSSMLENIERKALEILNSYDEPRTIILNLLPSLFAWLFGLYNSLGLNVLIKQKYIPLEFFSDSNKHLSSDLRQLKKSSLLNTPKIETLLKERYGYHCPSCRNFPCICPPRRGIGYWTMKKGRLKLLRSEEEIVDDTLHVIKPRIEPAAIRLINTNLPEE